MPLPSSPTLLLHACCGPCAIAPVLRLREEGFAVTALFVNPNIHPLSEYLRRREAMRECAARLELPVLWRDDLWDVRTWLREASARQDAGKVRCHWCYASRLAVTARTAAQEGFSCFSSSLLYSRHQRHEDIRRIAAETARAENASFLYRDFREEWQKGIDISKEFAVYRQPYCGCIYSEAERYEKKLKKILQDA